VVGSALEDSFGGPAVVAALSARISDITLTANNSNFSESELWDIFFSGEAGRWVADEATVYHRLLLSKCNCISFVCTCSGKGKAVAMGATVSQEQEAYYILE
jgi:hypothetical protein